MTELFFWNSYKPTCLNDIKHNGRNIYLLKNIAKNDLQHLYLTGLQTDFTSYVGRLLIKEINGKEFPLRYIKFILTPTTTVEILCSGNHYEFDMNYYKYMRRDIPLLIIEKIVRHKNISNNSYHIIIIQNANLMTYNVQAAFRRLMEKYIRSCRFIFTSQKNNGLMEALRSRCLTIRFTKPSYDEYRIMLSDISKRVELNIEDSVYEMIYENSNGIIDGVNLLQLYSLNPNAIKFKQKYDPYKEIFFYIKRGDIRYFRKIQNILFNLHSLDVNYSVIIKRILDKIIADKSLKPLQKNEAVSAGAECDWRCARSNRSIVGLNLFIGKVIKIYGKKI